MSVPKYGGAGETQAVRVKSVSDIVDLQTWLLERAKERTNLRDTEAVRRVAAEVMTECGRIGVLPNFEQLASALGYSRRGLYDFLERHPEEATVEFIDQLRTSWAAARQMAADRGVVGETMSIFVLLNSSLGFTNQHQIEFTANPGPLELSAADVDAVRQRYVEALPPDAEDE